MRIISQQEISTYSEKCSNLFISPEWLNVIKITYGIVFNAVISEEGSFLLPFCIIRNESFTSVKSIPFGDYTLNNCSINQIEEALNLLKDKYPENYIETSIVTKEKPSIINFDSTKYGYLIQVDIQQWKKSRNWKEAYERNIRNALNYGLAVKINKSFAGIEDFYKLHENLRINKFKKLPQPIMFFKNIYNTFFENDKGFLLEAWDKNKLIASWLILEHAKSLYYKFGASDIDSLHLRPNDLLFRTLMQYGSDNGFQTIDLGFSGATKSYEGLIRFKSKEGGKKIPIYRLEYYPDKLDVSLIEKEKEYSSEITKKALKTGSLSTIRKTSDKYYGKFA